MTGSPSPSLMSDIGKCLHRIFSYVINYFWLQAKGGKHFGVNLKFEMSNLNLEFQIDPLAEVCFPFSFWLSEAWGGTFSAFQISSGTFDPDPLPSYPLFPSSDTACPREVGMLEVQQPNSLDPIIPFLGVLQLSKGVGGVSVEIWKGGRTF